MQHEFTLKFGDLSIQQYVGLTGDRTWVTGRLHRLTSEQFDALTAAFEVVEDTKTLTTDTKYGAAHTFRTAEIDFGGLTLSLYADVPAHEVDPNQLILTEL
jgi:hypothetical protein